VRSGTAFAIGRRKDDFGAVTAGDGEKEAGCQWPAVDQYEVERSYLSQ